MGVLNPTGERGTKWTKAPGGPVSSCPRGACEGLGPRARGRLSFPPALAAVSLSPCALGVVGWGPCDNTPWVTFRPMYFGSRPPYFYFFRRARRAPKTPPVFQIYMPGYVVAVFPAPFPRAVQALGGGLPLRRQAFLRRVARGRPPSPNRPRSRASAPPSWFFFSDENSRCRRSPAGGALLFCCAAAVWPAGHPAVSERPMWGPTHAGGPALLRLAADVVLMAATRMSVSVWRRPSLCCSRRHGSPAALRPGPVAVARFRFCFCFRGALWLGRGRSPLGGVIGPACPRFSFPSPVRRLAFLKTRPPAPLGPPAQITRPFLTGPSCFFKKRNSHCGPRPLVAANPNKQPNPDWGVFSLTARSDFQPANVHGKGDGYRLLEPPTQATATRTAPA